MLFLKPLYLTYFSSWRSYLFAALFSSSYCSVATVFRPSISLRAVRNSYKLNVVVLPGLLWPLSLLLFFMGCFVSKNMYICVHVLKQLFIQGVPFTVFLCMAAVTGCRGWCGLTLRYRCRARAQDKRDTVCDRVAVDISLCMRYLCIATAPCYVFLVYWTTMLAETDSGDNWQRMLNWKGSGKKRSWPISVTVLAFTKDIRSAGGDSNCTRAAKWSGALARSAASF